MDKQPLLPTIPPPSYTESIGVPITVQPTISAVPIEVTVIPSTIINPYHNRTQMFTAIPVTEPEIKTTSDQCPECVRRRAEKQIRESGSNDCCYGPSLCDCGPGVCDCSDSSSGSNDGEAIIVVAIVCGVCMLLGCCFYIITEACNDQEGRCSTCGNII